MRINCNFYCADRMLCKYIAIISSDAQRCTQITLQLAEPMGELDLSRLEWDYDSPQERLRQRLLHKYNNLSLQNMDASQAFFEILQAARRNNLLGV